MKAHAITGPDGRIKELLRALTIYLDAVGPRPHADSAWKGGISLQFDDAGAFGIFGMDD